MDANKDIFSLKPVTKNEFTVTEISQHIKKVIEENFEFVRVKGEISSFKIAPSGHAYFSLKDDKSLLAAICWKGCMDNLKCKPEEGMEVVCTGSITTYAGHSKYQLIVTSIEAAGIGALMALLEKRKQQLQAEGLFDQIHKKPLPFLPRTIGVVTSITGAVIKDIIHRISDRFPSRLIIWPVLVQGPQSAEQIAQAIEGFNTKLGVDTPDLIIVARGGGSIEDLWSFNEEIVVRAVFHSQIPIISAIGHETDITLIDYVADRRAPTPTAAAEIAVPVRRDLILGLADLNHRIIHAIDKKLNYLTSEITSLGRALPNLNKILFEYEQKCDDFFLRLNESSERYFHFRKNILDSLIAKIANPIYYLDKIFNNCSIYFKTLTYIIQKKLYHFDKQFDELKFSINPKLLFKEFDDLSINLANLYESLSYATNSKNSEKEMLLKATNSLFESYNYKNTLKRGFAVVKKDNLIIKSINDLNKIDTYSLQIFDGITKIKISD
jgi:exodeoxyribonuclease VII large subunit